MRLSNAAIARECELSIDFRKSYDEKLVEISGILDGSRVVHGRKIKKKRYIPSPYDIVKFFLPLMSLNHTVMGMHGIANGEICKWTELLLGWEAFAWGTAIQLHEIEQGKRDPIFWIFIDISISISSSLAFGKIGAARYFFDKSRKCLEPALFAKFVDQHLLLLTSRIVPFVYKLAGRLFENDVNVEHGYIANMKRFSDVFNNWDNPDGLRNCMHHLMEYRYAKARKENEQLSHDYVWPLAKWFPFEILMIFAVRKMMGLSTLPFEHPFFHTHLANIPEKPEAYKSELLERITSWLISQIPSLAELKDCLSSK